jgi:hypothetical protein
MDEPARNRTDLTCQEEPDGRNCAHPPAFAASVACDLPRKRVSAWACFSDKPGVAGAALDAHPSVLLLYHCLCRNAVPQQRRLVV